LEGMPPHLVKPGALPARTSVPPGMKTQPLKVGMGEFLFGLDIKII
jgi:hypothetical protein